MKFVRATLHEIRNFKSEDDKFHNVLLDFEEAEKNTTHVLTLELKEGSTLEDVTNQLSKFAKQLKQKAEGGKDAK